MHHVTHPPIPHWQHSPSNRWTLRVAERMPQPGGCTDGWKVNTCMRKHRVDLVHSTWVAWRSGPAHQTGRTTGTPSPAGSRGLGMCSTRCTGPTETRPQARHRTSLHCHKRTCGPTPGYEKRRFSTRRLCSPSVVFPFLSRRWDIQWSTGCSAGNSLGGSAYLETVLKACFVELNEQQLDSLVSPPAQHFTRSHCLLWEILLRCPARADLIKSAIQICAFMYVLCMHWATFQDIRWLP